MSFEFESVNPSFQEVSQGSELQYHSQSDTSGELADGELDERDLEVINGGCPPPKPPNPLDVARQKLLRYQRMAKYE
ncbi:hypothetical protein QUA70_12090 [Microcoleus sp. LAD1_D5]|uniref:hypothetical protein n=1 Tax=unclassified Microcoleus TaxID=2642155 RepID=UPI002FD71165